MDANILTTPLVSSGAFHNDKFFYGAVFLNISPAGENEKKKKERVNCSKPSSDRNLIKGINTLSCWDSDFLGASHIKILIDRFHRCYFLGIFSDPHSCIFLLVKMCQVSPGAQTSKRAAATSNTSGELEFNLESKISSSLVGWGCRIHRLNLCRGLRLLLCQRIFWI